MEEGVWRKRLRRVLLALGAVFLGVPTLLFDVDSTGDLLALFLGFLLLMTGLYLWKRAADDERRRRRSILEDVGGEADVAAENELLPRRDPFEDGDG